MQDKNWERYLEVRDCGNGKKLKAFLKTLSKNELIRIVLQATYSYDALERNNNFD